MSTPVDVNSITDEQLCTLMVAHGISPTTYLWATTGDISDLSSSTSRDRDRRNRNDARARAVVAWNKRSP